MKKEEVDQMVKYLGGIEQLERAFDESTEYYKSEIEQFSAEGKTVNEIILYYEEMEANYINCDTLPKVYCNIEVMKIEYILNNLLRPAKKYLKNGDRHIHLHFNTKEQNGTEHMENSMNSMGLDLKYKKVGERNFEKNNTIIREWRGTVVGKRKVNLSGVIGK